MSIPTTDTVRQPFPHNTELINDKPMYTQGNMLTRFSRMEFPTTINWTSPFPFLGLLGGIFRFIQISIEHSALFAYVPQKGR